MNVYTLIQHNTHIHTIAASECIFNMDMSDLCGRTIKVSLAQQNQLSKLSDGKGQAIWSSDEWFQENAIGGTEEERQNAKDAQRDKETLKD